jgi:hypothetical protein
MFTFPFRPQLERMGLMQVQEGGAGLVIALLFDMLVSSTRALRVCVRAYARVCVYLLSAYRM